MRQSHQHEANGWISRSTWVLIGFLAIAGYFLLSEHRAHFIDVLPFLLLAACPLMHLFHGHGDRGGQRRGAEDEPPTAKPRPRPEGDSR